VITREVPRPAIAARYFGTFNAVDIHDQRRQSELGLESKWVAKGDNAGKFRLATTIFGMTVVDTQLALTCHSYPGHALRSMTTKDFAEVLAEEMVDNELNGELSRPKITRKRDTRQSTAPEPPNAAHKHVLVKIGKTSLGVIVQLHCVMCKKKASKTCSGAGCGNVSICANGKRTCHIDHCNGECTKKVLKKGRTCHI